MEEYGRINIRKKENMSTRIPEHLEPNTEGITLPTDLTHREGEKEFVEKYKTGPYGKLKEVKTADIIIFTPKNNTLHVLLIQRGNHPYKNYWCFPGGFVDPQETPLVAAVRELEEETSITIPPEDLTLVGEYKTPWRDPRMKNNISTAYTYYTETIPKHKAGDDAIGARFVPVSEILDGTIKLGFDHGEILLKALTV